MSLTVTEKKTPIFCTGWFRTIPKYILTKFRDAKIDIFDIIEKIVTLCFGNASTRYNINDCVHIELFDKLCDFDTNLQNRLI